MDATERMTVGIVAERHHVEQPWPLDRWSVTVALAGEPEVPPWTVLAEGPGWTRYYAGCAEVALFRSEAENYKHNLDSRDPALYVILRRRPEPPGMGVLLATVDPGEIDTHADSGDDLIEALPLPPTLAAWMRAFVEQHYVAQPFHKRRRDRADPEALAVRRPDPREPRHG